MPPDPGGEAQKLGISCGVTGVGDVADAAVPGDAAMEAAATASAQEHRPLEVLRERRLACGEGLSRALPGSATPASDTPGAEASEGSDGGHEVVTEGADTEECEACGDGGSQERRSESHAFSGEEPYEMGGALPGGRVGGRGEEGTCRLGGETSSYPRCSLSNLSASCCWS